MKIADQNSMEQFRKFNEKLNKIDLDEKYFFAFTNTDGFTPRLLQAQLVVDYDYNFELELSAFMHEDKTVNKSNSITEKGKLPKQLLQCLEDLLMSDYLSLKSNYDFETFIITGTGHQQYLFSLEKTTTNIDIVDGLPEEYFQSISEKKLFAFNEYLKELTANKYQNWAK
ncbi:MAG: hypothetical protein RL660_2318 [Bacteroidota bacterium]|jgi:hypothetical protein